MIIRLMRQVTWERGFGGTDGIMMLSERHDICSTSNVRYCGEKMLWNFLHAFSYKWEKEPFICGIFMLLSFSFRDLVILTKFCQTRSIGSPDAFFQFPLKCFQQRLPFLLLKNTLQRWKKLQKKEQIIHCQWHWQSTGSPKNLLALTRHWFFINNSNKDFCIYMLYRITFFQTTLSNQAQLECFVWLFGRLNPREDHKHSL